MGEWFGVLTSVLLIYPQLYPGYLMSEEKQNLGVLKIGVNTIWILLFICVAGLVFAFILFWRGGWFHQRKRTDH